MSFLIANGQVAATATALSTATTSDLWTLHLRNTSGATTETVEITVQRDGGTARKYPRVVLAPNCGATYANIPVEDDDILLATTTNATTVDYDLTGVGANGNQVLPNFPPFSLVSYDANGGQVTAAGTTSSATITGTTAVVGKKFTVSPAPTDTFAASMNIDVTYGIHFVAAANGTSATVTYTPTSAGTAGDRVTIITATDGSGTVTATFASTFKSSGTQATTASKFSSITFVSNGTAWIEECRVTALT